MERIDLGATLAPVLSVDAAGEMQRPGEDLLQLALALDPALDVADHAAELGFERPERLAGALELMGMGVALVLDQRALADAGIGLAPDHTLLPRQPDQPRARALQQSGVGGEHHIIRTPRRTDGGHGDE